ncbi:MAG: class I SAM-dependent methyltransferase [Deltaproteobacteria bacterium]|nr:class I SAM-dependent methyltransferase [Deltaproteobacteria bacterium]
MRNWKTVTVHQLFRLVLLGLAVAWGVGLWLHHKEEERRELTRAFESGYWAKDRAGRGTSWPGSTLEVTAEYRAYVERFIRSHHVESVVDAGCGDWSFSAAIDWGGASYLGVDISPQIVQRLKRRFAREAVAFEVGDATESLPAADLLLCKDVLQHLPNDKVLEFIKNNLTRGKFKWAIITNDKGGRNHDIFAGEYRPLDLGAPPFEVEGLVDLPVKFADNPLKVAQLLDLSR